MMTGDDDFLSLLRQWLQFTCWCGVFVAAVMAAALNYHAGGSPFGTGAFLALAALAARVLAWMV